MRASTGTVLTSGSFLSVGAGVTSGISGGVFGKRGGGGVMGFTRLREKGGAALLLLVKYRKVAITKMHKAMVIKTDIQKIGNPMVGGGGIGVICGFSCTTKDVVSLVDP